MTRLVCFDVDGTLVRPRSGKEFREDADDWRLLPGREEGLSRLIADGVSIALVSNQGGVAFGLLDRPAIEHALADLARALYPPPHPPWFYRHVRVYCCVHHPRGTVPPYGADCFYRKPQPGMLLKAMLDAEVGPRGTLMVGDRAEDEQAAAAAGVAFRWADDYFRGDQDAAGPACHPRCP